ncbi:hypothetical protein [Vibrio nereis]|uniref:hypothetical protein n=1 Tax=Vibrio nereis TaxID=693 RepID=UPI0024959D0B|nr:hypothetical protein [Vibrio nereis]
MRWIGILCIIFSISAWGTPVRDNADLSQFDHPFLLGDWYLINPNPEESQENFLAIKLSLNSSYSFIIDIQKRDYSVDHWEGLYNANEDTLVLGLETSEPQVYQYVANHNLLIINGVTFTKALSNSLAGLWSSAHLAGDDLLASEVHRMDLLLQPDFVFTFRVSNEDGEESIHQGVYYTEGDHLVLMYEDGEHDTRYTLHRDTLTLGEKKGEMYAVLNRIR